MSNYKTAKSIYDFTARDLEGNPVPLEKYKGHVCIVVNVASRCGLAKTNYSELAELFEAYSDTKGLRVLAFPCNQFAGTEPGSAADISEFVKQQQAKFDVFEKVNVNGSDAHPLWKYLKQEQGGILGDFVKWNYTKFIVDRKGKPVERYGPNVNPKELVTSLEKYW